LSSDEEESLGYTKIVSISDFSLIPEMTKLLALLVVGQSEN